MNINNGFNRACPSGNHMLNALEVTWGDIEVEQCTNCGNDLKEGEGDEFNDLLFCDQACISEWWQNTVERWGEDR